MVPPVAELLHLLDLEAIEVNIFRGVSIDTDRLRVFGGQVASQALVAAGRTAPRGTRVHSLHSYFLRPGDPNAPILYQVDRIRDGRSFATRRVVAIQHGEAIFNLQCSFHSDEAGLEHHDPMPLVQGPEQLERPHRPESDIDDGSRAYPEPRGLDVRFVTELPWDRNGEQHDREVLWLRASGPLGDDPLVHAAVVTFASDLTLVDSILQRHGISPGDPGFAGASLDHCMWFHKAFRADGWLLYDHRSPVASGGRGLAQGAIYDKGGDHVVTVVQEGLIRMRPGPGGTGRGGPTAVARSAAPPATSAA